MEDRYVANYIIATLGTLGIEPRLTEYQSAFLTIGRYAFNLQRLGFEPKKPFGDRFTVCCL